jgi:hypothetical protein
VKRGSILPASRLPGPIRKLADDGRAARHDIGAVIGVVLGKHHQARPDEDRFLQIVTIS